MSDFVPDMVAERTVHRVAGWLSARELLCVMNGVPFDHEHLFFYYTSQAARQRGEASVVQQGGFLLDNAELVLPEAKTVPFEGVGA